MAMFSRGKLVDANLILSEAQTLPNNTSADSTNSVKFIGSKTGLMQINVVAATAISIADTKQLKIVAAYGTTSSPTTSLYDVIYDRTASGSAVTFAQGDLIASYTIPQDKAGTYNYVKLTYTTTADESSEKVDAFITIA